MAATCTCPSCPKHYVAPIVMHTGGYVVDLPLAEGLQKRLRPLTNIGGNGVSVAVLVLGGPKAKVAELKMVAALVAPGAVNPAIEMHKRTQHHTAVCIRGSTVSVNYGFMVLCVAETANALNEVMIKVRGQLPEEDGVCVF